MMSLKTLIMSSVLAQGALALDTTIVSGSGDCPSSWSRVTYKDDDYCCYGSAVSNINNGVERSYCCVQDPSVDLDFDFDFDFGSDDPDECFFCDEAKRAVATSSCVDEVPYTVSDYSARVSKASKSVQAAASQGSETGSSESPATTTAEPTTINIGSGNPGTQINVSTGSHGEITVTGASATDQSESAATDSPEITAEVSQEDSQETNSDNAALPLITGDAALKFGGAVAAAAMLAL